jgi:hypothetical protein
MRFEANGLKASSTLAIVSNMGPPGAPWEPAQLERRFPVESASGSGRSTVDADVTVSAAMRSLRTLICGGAMSSYDAYAKLPLAARATVSSRGTAGHPGRGALHPAWRRQFRPASIRFGMGNAQGDQKDQGAWRVWRLRTAGGAGRVRNQEFDLRLELLGQDDPFPACLATSSDGLGTGLRRPCALRRTRTLLPSPQAASLAHEGG